jgi:hypothetical protein
MQCQIARPSNNRIQLTVKSVTKFAIANFPPLFTSADAGVSTQLLQNGLVGKLFLKVLIHRIYLLAFFTIHRAI